MQQTKSEHLCRDCQKSAPLYVGGVMYKRCNDCLDAFTAKREANRVKRARAFQAAFIAAGSK